jgi:hypothetical protein
MHRQLTRVALPGSVFGDGDPERRPEVTWTSGSERDRLWAEFGIVEEIEDDFS